MKTLILTVLTLTFLSCSTKGNNKMGLFDKLFGEKEIPKQKVKNVTSLDTTQLVKTAEMLDEDCA